MEQEHCTFHDGHYLADKRHAYTITQYLIGNLFN